MNWAYSARKVRMSVTWAPGGRLRMRMQSRRVPWVMKFWGMVMGMGVGDS